MTDTPNVDNPRYINAAEARAANLKSRLPLVEDIPTTGQGTAFNRELQRLNKAWLSYTYSTDRRIGVGSEVIIGPGVPIQVAGSFDHLITNGELKGKLIKETTWMYPDGRATEVTDALFTVTVDIPRNSQPEDFLNPSTIDIHVPNDLLKKVQSQPAEPQVGH